MTTTVVHECIAEKQCNHLNPHVIQKSYVEDLYVLTKPAKASARKVDSIDAASDNSDSDLSTKRMQTSIRKRRNTKGERKRPGEHYNRKKGRAIIKQQDYKQVIRKVLRIKRNKALQTQFRLLYQVLQLN